MKEPNNIYHHLNRDYCCDGTVPLFVTLLLPLLPLFLLPTTYTNTTNIQKQQK